MSRPKKANKQADIYTIEWTFTQVKLVEMIVNEAIAALAVAKIEGVANAARNAIREQLQAIAETLSS